MQTEPADPTELIADDIKSMVESFPGDTDSNTTAEKMGKVKYFMTRSLDPKEIADIVERIYTVKESYGRNLYSLVIQEGIQSMLTSDGIFTREDKLKDNAADILLSIDNRGYLGKLMPSIYEEWQNEGKFTQNESTGGTEVLQMIMMKKDYLQSEESKLGLELLQKNIILDGVSYLFELPRNEGRMIKGSNAERVILSVFCSLEGDTLSKWSEEETERARFLYNKCIDNELCERLKGVEKKLGISK